MLQAKARILSLPLFILAIMQLNGQTIRFSAPSYEAFACYGSTVNFDKTLECPTGTDCFATVDYGDGTKDTMEIDAKMSHYYDNDGSFNVSITLLSKADSSLIDSKTKTGIVQIYDPTGFAISAEADTLRSYIYYLQATRSDQVHDTAAWVFEWSFYDGTSYGTDTMSAIVKTVFPEENLDPGYRVSLKVAMNEYSEATTFISNYEECFDTISEYIIVEDLYFEDPSEEKIKERTPNLYNVITPDGDPNDGNDLNDVFEVVTNGVDIFTISIYNSYGNVVFTQTGKEISWTGVTNSGKRVKSGSYYYAITSNAPGKKHYDTGFIHVINEDF